MLSNTFIGSEFVEILFSFPTWSCVKRCHTVPRPVPRTWQCVIWYRDQCLSPGNVSYGTMTSAFHLALCHMVPRPVYFTWQCVIWENDQCNLAICYTVQQPVCFTWHCAMRYHDQCLSRGNVSCGTTNSVFHLAMCYTVPRPVPFTWPYVMRYNDQCNLAICHTVLQPVYCTWQYVIRYHNQCISAVNVLCGTTTSVFHLPMCYAVPQMKKLLRIS
jgi:hypothetical protein